MVIYVPVSLNLIGQSVFEVESGNENVDKQTNGQNFANLISKLNFYKLIPYPMDREGPPN